MIAWPASSKATKKPSPGMLERARDEMGIDPTRSYMIGDSGKDIVAGHSVGATTIMVRTGYGKGEIEYRSAGWKIQPDHIADDLLAAVEWILEREQAGASPSKAAVES